MDAGLDREQRAPGQRAVLAALLHRMAETPVEAGLADRALGDEVVRGTSELVVVQGHDGRDARGLQRLQDAGGQLVVDVVQVHDVGLEALDRRPDPTA